MARAADPKSYYRVLGVQPSATAEEIRVAFRDAAKRYHPDQGGEADGEKFQQLTEAYHTLRDGRRRMQYDAAGIAETSTIANQAGDAPKAGTTEPRWKRAAVNQGGSTASAPRSGPTARASRPSRVTVLGVQSRFPAAIAVIAATMAVVLLATLGFLWSAQQRVAEQELLLADAHDRLDTAVSDQSMMRARISTSGFVGLEEALAASRQRGEQTDPGYVFQAELTFPSGVVDLDLAMQRQADGAILGLVDIIERIPSEREWLILLEGFAASAADQAGVTIGDWENALLRLGSLTNYMTAQGLPPERLAVRFQAGYQSTSVDQSRTARIEIKLVCCFR